MAYLLRLGIDSDFDDPDVIDNGSKTDMDASRYSFSLERIGHLIIALLVFLPVRAEARSDTAATESFSQQSMQCLVVTGFDSDHDSVFSHEKLALQIGMKVGNAACKTFKSWDELSKSVKSSNSNDSLLIIQFAHGTSRGFQCDGGRETAYSISSALTSLSRNRRVAAFIESCHSGDIMSKFLSEESSISANLCLATTSFWGLPQIFDEREDSIRLSNVLEKIRPGDNAEDVFNKLEGGLISSAAWSQSGITDYLMTADIRMARDVLRNVATIGESAPEFEGRLSCKLAARPDVDHVAFSVLAGLNAATRLMSREDISDWIKYLDNYRANETSWLTKKRKCISSFRDFLQNEMLQMDIWSSASYSGVDKLVPKFFRHERSNDFNACRAAGFNAWEDIPAPERQKQVFLNDVFAPYAHIASDAVLYSKAIRQLAALFPNTNWESIGWKPHDKDWQLVFDKALASPNMGTQREKQELLRAIVGQSLLSYRRFDSERGRGLNINSALNGFVRGSLRLKNIENSLDQRRRAACRDFRF